jgi:hypothetical protein
MIISALFVALDILISSTVVLAAPAPVARAFNPSQYDNPYNGPPINLFQGSSSFPISSLASAA